MDALQRSSSRKAGDGEIHRVVTGEEVAGIRALAGSETGGQAAAASE